MDIELVYEKSCPNIEAARVSLLQAFSKAGITPHWREWDVATLNAPAHVHGYGSPTILVDGRDVSGDSTAGDDYCCRIYSQGPGAAKGTPHVALALLIAASLWNTWPKAPRAGARCAACVPSRRDQVRDHS